MFFLVFCTLNDGQRELIREIFRKNRALFYSTALGILHSKSGAEDAVSESFLKIIKNIDRISKIPCPQMVSFCVTIVKNTSIDILRREKRFRPTSFEELDSCVISPQVTDIENLMDREADALRLAELIRGLPAEEKLLIKLRFAEELGFAEISIIMGISEEAAKKRSQRLVRKLKKLFEGGDSIEQKI